MPRAHGTHGGGGGGDELAALVTVDLREAGGMLLSMLGLERSSSAFSWNHWYGLLHKEKGTHLSETKERLKKAQCGGWTVPDLRLLLDALAEVPRPGHCGGGRWVVEGGGGGWQAAAERSSPPPPLVLLQYKARPSGKRGVPFSQYRLNPAVSPPERERRLASFPLPRFLREELLWAEDRARAVRARIQTEAAAEAAAAAASVAGLSWLGQAEGVEVARSTLEEGKRVAVRFADAGWVTGRVSRVPGQREKIAFWMECDGYEGESSVSLESSLALSYGRHREWVMIPEGCEAAVWREEGHELLGQTGRFRDATRDDVLFKGVVRLWRPAAEGGAGDGSQASSSSSAAEAVVSVAIFQPRSQTVIELVLSLKVARAAVAAVQRPRASAGAVPPPPSVSVPAAPPRTGWKRRRSASPSPQGEQPVVSQYERNRLDSVARNNAMLVQLGLLPPLGGSAAGMASPAAPAPANPAPEAQADAIQSMSQEEEANASVPTRVSALPTEGVPMGMVGGAPLSAAEAPIELAEPMDVELPPNVPMPRGAAAPIPGGVRARIPEGTMSSIPGAAPAPIPGSAPMPIPVGSPMPMPAGARVPTPPPARPSSFAPWDGEDEDAAWDNTDAMLEWVYETQAELEEPPVEAGRRSQLPYAQAFYLESMGVLQELSRQGEQQLAAGWAPGMPSAQMQQLLDANLSTGQRRLRLPTPAPGGTLAYRAHVNTQGQLQLYPPERRGRTLAAAAFGSEQLLLVSFSDLPREDGTGARQEAERAQRRALERGIRVCGREFALFCAKEDNSAKDTKAVFIARSHRAAASGGTETGTGNGSVDTGRGGSVAGWSSPAEARRMLADFTSLPSAKLSKRLALAFSQTTRCLSACVQQVHLVDLRQPPPGQAAAAAGLAFLSAARSAPGSRPAAPALLPLLRRAGAEALAAAGAPLEGSVRILIVDDIAGVASGGQGSGHIMTDGAGLISVDLMQRVAADAAAHAKTCAGTGGGDNAEATGSALGAQVRLWFHGAVAKGMLLVASPLPARTIVLTSSTVKVQPAGPAQWPGFYFELVRLTEGRGREPRAGSLLIPILQHGCGLQPAVRYLKKLVAEGVREMPAGAQATAHDAPNRGAKMGEMILRATSRGAGRIGRGGGGEVGGDGGGARAADLVDAGFSPLHEPWLMRKASELVASEFKRLREGKLPLGKHAHYVIGCVRLGIDTLTRSSRACCSAFSPPPPSRSPPSPCQYLIPPR